VARPGSVLPTPLTVLRLWNPPVMRDPTPPRERAKGRFCGRSRAANARKKLRRDKAMEDVLQLSVAIRFCWGPPRRPPVGRPRGPRRAGRALRLRQTGAAAAAASRAAQRSRGRGGLAKRALKRRRPAAVWRLGCSRALAPIAHFYAAWAWRAGAARCHEIRAPLRAARPYSPSPGTLPMKSRLPSSTPLWRRMA
jgi:hypothetical protein